VFMTKGDIIEYKIALPSLEVQQQIVGLIEQESRQVNSAENLIKTYEARTQVAIAKLWSE